MVFPGDKPIHFDSASISEILENPYEEESTVPGYKQTHFALALISGAETFPYVVTYPYEETLSIDDYLNLSLHKRNEVVETIVIPPVLGSSSSGFGKILLRSWLPILEVKR